MNVSKIKLWPKSTMKSSSKGLELSDEQSVLKHCVSEIQHSNLLPKSSGTKNPSDMVETLVWSNPTFLRVDEAEEKYDVAITENTRQKDPYAFCLPTPSSLVFSFNLSLDGKGPASSEVPRSNPRGSNSIKPDRVNEVICGDFPQTSRSRVRNPVRISEAEANIRAELAREIEKELELELEQQIAILSCRLQNLRAQRKSEIPVNGLQKTSLQKNVFPQNHHNSNNKSVEREKKISPLRSGSGGNLSLKGFCSVVDVLTQSVPLKKPMRRLGNDNNSSIINCRDMKRDKQPSSMEKIKRNNVSQSFNLVDKSSKVHLIGARSFKAK